MIGLRGIVSAVKVHYDKLIAVAILLGLLASVVYLAVRVGMIRKMQQDFDGKINLLTPQHAEAADQDVAAFERSREELERPFQVAHETWTNRMAFVPGSRVWCVDCRNPIALPAMICPFCEAKQPIRRDIDPTYDGDGDTIPDLTEKELGLDPFDATDATKDPDGDGFVTIEEIRAGTHPLDPKSVPPYEWKLRLAGIKTTPFRLLFKSVIKMPDGNKFAVNTQSNSQTWFKKLTEEVEGFVLVKYEPKTVKVTRGNIERTVDVSILTLRRGTKSIELQRGRREAYDEALATLFFEVDESEYKVREGDTFALKANKYKVIEIDTKTETVVIQRANGDKLEVRRSPRGSGGDESGQPLQGRPGARSRPL